MNEKDIGIQMENKKERTTDSKYHLEIIEQIRNIYVCKADVYSNILK